MVAMVVSRRGAAVLVSSLVSTNPNNMDPSPIDRIADIICTCTPPTFRRAIVENARKTSRSWLYRGHGWTTKVTNDQEYRFEICHPQPDLLLPGTYDDPNALEYFEFLESQLSSYQVRPSTGHMVTSVVQNAASWGDVVSVWPLGERFEYAWPRKRSVFFPCESCTTTCVEEHGDIQINTGLKVALQQDREVLFTSWWDSPNEKIKLRNNQYNTIHSSWTSAFLAVSLEHSDELQQALSRRNYGL